MKTPKVRHQLFLPSDLSERLEKLAAKPGASKSSILGDALTTWLDRQAASELEQKFAHRLDRMSMALGRIERDGHVLLESLALFIRYELAVTAPLAENDKAGRAQARQRFTAFVARVGEALATDKRSFAPPALSDTGEQS